MTEPDNQTLGEDFENILADRGAELYEDIYSKKFTLEEVQSLSKSLKNKGFLKDGMTDANVEFVPFKFIKHLDPNILTNDEFIIWARMVNQLCERFQHGGQHD